MNAVRGVLRDLVERRLWPVALLLVAAAVAVPVYLGRSSDDATVDTPVPAVTAQTGAKASKAAVTVQDSAADSDGRGDVRNPFKQQHVPKAATADAGATSGGSGSAPPPSGSAGGSAPSGSTPSGGAPSGGTGPGDTGGSTDTTPKSDTPKVDPKVSHVTVRLGAVGSLTTYKDVARLSAVPSASKTYFVFTGVLKDGKTAVLLPSSNVKISPESDVACKPSNTTCETLEVHEDDTIFFTLPTDAAPTQYQLDIVTVRQRTASGTTAATAAALQRHSKAGAAMLRDAHVNAGASFHGASAYRWLPDQGVLVRTPQHSKAHASANGAVAASSADVAAALPGLPVWHWHPGA
jgi:hypothetical protein